MTLATSSQVTSTGTCELKCTLAPDIVHKIKFRVESNLLAPLVFEMAWLRSCNPVINWVTSEVSFHVGEVPAGTTSPALLSNTFALPFKIIDEL